MGKVADLSVYTPGGQPGAPTPSEGLAVLRQNQTAFMETIGAMPPESLTIADGAISPTTAVCIVDAEGGAPADDLTTINATLPDGSTLHDGMVILLSAKDESRVVTVKNSDAPNGVKTVDGKDIALSTEWSLVLQYVGGVWQQISISAPLRAATSDMLGGVKPQTGDEDGLELGPDGTLRLKVSSPTVRGGGKASETPQAYTVPHSRADGTIDPAWMPSVLRRTGGQMDGEILFSTGYAARRTIDTGALAISGGTGYEGTDATLYLYGKGHSNLEKAGLVEFLTGGTRFSFGANGIYLSNNRHVLMHDDIYMEVIPNNGPVKYLPVGGTWIFMRVQFRREDGTIIEASMHTAAGGSPVNISNENTQLIYAFRVSM